MESDFAHLAHTSHKGLCEVQPLANEGESLHFAHSHRAEVYSDYVTSYLNRLKLLNYSPASIETRQTAITGFSRWMKEKGIRDFQNITSEEVKQYQAYLEFRNLSGNTVDTWLRGMKDLFGYLEKRNIIFLNPFEGYEFPRLGLRLPRDILTEEEVKRILASPNLSRDEGIRNRAILEVLYSTAIRNQESSLLKVQDVDFSSGLLRVQGKGRKERIVPLGKKACEYLKLYIEKVRPKYALDPDCQFLFLAAKNRKLEGQSINLMAKLIGRKLGLSKPVTTHSFRRAAVTHMLKAGAHPMFIQKMLGHATNETMKKYLMVTGKEVKETHEHCHPREKGRET